MRDGDGPQLDEEGDPGSGLTNEPPWQRGVMFPPSMGRSSAQSACPRTRSDPGGVRDMSTRPLLSAGDGLAFRSEPVRCGGDRFLRRRFAPWRRPGDLSWEAYGDRILIRWIFWVSNQKGDHIVFLKF